MDKLKLWEDATEKLKKRINGHLLLTKWKFAQGIERGELPGTDDSGWEEKDGSLNWSMKDGIAYFRNRFVLPCEIEGVPTQNSNVDLTFFFPSGVEVFIDGQKVYGHKYWADKIATPFPLMKHAAEGEERLIVFKTPAGDGLGSFWAELNISEIEEILFELDSILYQIKFACKLSEGAKNKHLRKYADRALATIDPEDIDRNDWRKTLADIKNAEKELEAFRKEARKFRVHLIGHAHIDMNWLWDYEDTIHTCLRDFETVNKLLEKYPDLTFSQSQAHVYKIVEDHDRELFKKVQEKVKEKRWEVTASTWVEGDLNMSDGESFVRHFLYAGKYTREKLGAATDVFWSPDTFGHPVTTPSILSSAGMKYYYFMRCGKGLPLFRWKSRDGGELLAFNSIYNNTIKPANILTKLIEYSDRYSIPDFLFVYGVGDHGGGPTEKDIKRKMLMERKPVFPSLEFSTVRKYFKSVEKHRNKLPVVEGELNTIFEGCYTTHSDIKKANRDCENKLLTLEALSAAAGLKGKKSPESETEELWQKTLFNQFHDIFDGSAIHSSYDYSAKLTVEIKSKADKLIKMGMKNLVSGKKSTEDKITVFNPLGWERTAVISLPAKKGAFLTAETLPGYGYKTFSLTKDARISGNRLKQTGEEYENAFYKIKIDSETGLIATLYDKRNKCDVLSSCLSIREDHSSWWAEKAGNLISVSWEKPHSMSAWVIGNIYRTENLLDAESIETETDNLHTTISIRRRYMNSEILQKIIMYADFPYIDFENRIDWKQQGNNKDGVPIVRVNFNVGMKKPDAFFEVPFGAIKRNVLPKEYPALRWAGFNSGKYWTALLNRDKHGYHVDGNNLSLTLLRNAYEPDAVTDSGVHNISYRLFFGKNDVLGVTKAAVEYNMPPIAADGEAPEKDFCPLVVRGKVLPTSFKKTLGRNSYILRLVEIEGKKQTAEIEFAKPLKKAYSTDAAEHRQKAIQGARGRKLKLNIAPYQIVTLELEF